MKLSVKGFITSKDGEAYCDCADRMAIECRPSALRAAVSDGVSNGSFLQAHWAQILSEEFVSQSDEITTVPFDTCREKWYSQAAELANSPEAKWFTKNLFQRRVPGAATLVSLVVSAQNKLWYAESLGDSCLFYVPKNEENDYNKWITLTPDSFNNYPNYCASYPNMDKGQTVSEIGILQPGSLYMMTDALSEWLCNQKGDALSIIKTWENQHMFEDSIAKLRNDGLLHNDDSAIIIINIEDDGNSSFTYDNIIFTDINNMP